MTEKFLEKLHARLTRQKEPGRMRTWGADWVFHFTFSPESSESFLKLVDLLLEEGPGAKRTLPLERGPEPAGQKPQNHFSQLAILHADQGMNTFGEDDEKVIFEMDQTKLLEFREFFLKEDPDDQCLTLEGDGVLWFWTWRGSDNPS